MSRYDAALSRMVDERIGDLLPQQPGRMGVLVSVDAGAGCTVRFDGDVATTPVKRWAHVLAGPGDRVGLQRFESDWVVVGAFGTTSSASIETLGTSLGSITATTNTLVAGASTTVIKVQDDTRMRVRVTGGGWAQTATGASYELLYGVRISQASPAFTADYDVGRYFFNTTADHRAWGGHRTVAAIPAGTYTLQLFGRNSVAAKQTNLGVEDPWSVLWEEIN